MSKRSFSITSSAAAITAKPGGKSQAVFTVTSAAAASVRGQARKQVTAPTSADWLALDETERDFAPAETHNFTVSVTIPPGTPAGKYSFRLDVCNTANPDDDYTEGPLVAVHVGAPAPLLSKKPFPLWIIFVIAGILVAAIATTVIVLVNGKKTPAVSVVPDFTKDHPHIERLMEIFGSATNVIVEVVPDPFFIDDKNIRAGCIIKQTPSPGGIVPAGSTVKLNLQPELVEVPMVIGKDLPTAYQMLKEKQLNAIPVPILISSPVSPIVALQNPLTLLPKAGVVALHFHVGAAHPVFPHPDYHIEPEIPMAIPSIHLPGPQPP